ncbi:MAG TPA: phosphoribosylanthranilate isomerase [Opitutaceae bacterium]|nr:phosphoribosylanthranilate isomerase [Opitutaceae bacterium]
MIDGIQLKVCGLTSLADAECAERCGADYVAFNLYPKSPRYLPLAQARAMISRLPARKRGVVMVEPSLTELAEAKAAGFDFFQIHFRTGLELKSIAAWSAAVGPERLWLAPKLPPEADVTAAWLPLANFFLLDTFQREGFGGSGRTGDWPKFARHRRAHPEKTWILSGGLNAENIGDALRESGARFVDVNSGVESAPGVKDPERLRSFVASLRAAAAAC